MSEENVEIVRGLYEAWNRTGGVPPPDAISSDIEVEFKAAGLSEWRFRRGAARMEGALFVVTPAIRARRECAMAAHSPLASRVRAASLR